jgi:putative endonuclease
MRGGWTYIMTNHVRGVPYIGVTSNLAARIAQHRAGEGSSFCRKYNLRRLVLVERHDTIEDAIRREKLLKPGNGHGRSSWLKRRTRNGETCGMISTAESEVRFQPSLE